MAQAVSRRPLNAEDRVRCQVSPCEICGGQSGTGTGFSQSCRFSPVSFIPPVLYYTEKRKKLIIFLKKPQGCDASIEKRKWTGNTAVYLRIRMNYGIIIYNVNLEGNHAVTVQRRAFQSRKLGGLFRPEEVVGGWGKLLNEDLRKLYPLPNVNLNQHPSRNQD
jgi:hypothetical protein